MLNPNLHSSASFIHLFFFLAFHNAPNHGLFSFQGWFSSLDFFLRILKWFTSWMLHKLYLLIVSMVRLVINI
jgi:hypothetical protein